jgi:general secretion pathway protein L
MKSRKNIIIHKVNAHLPLADVTHPAVALLPLRGSTGPANPAFADLLPDAVRAQTTLIPAEMVALHIVTLPLRTARQRREALPFALEDAVAQSLENTHFALCGVAENGKVLAAATEVATLAAHLKIAPGNMLVPEQMILRRPDAKADGRAVWRAYCREDRVLVRVSDGTGFAAHRDMLRVLWLSAGKPAVESFGAPLGSDLVWADHADQALPHPASLADADLRQGRYRPARGLDRPLKLFAACAALAALGHLTIAAFDLQAQRTLANGLRKHAGAALAMYLPSAKADDAPALILRQLTAQTRPQVGSGFLPTLDRVAQSLSRAGNAVQFRQLAWDGDALRLTIEAPDLDTLQRAEASLRAANLQVTSGSATADAGAARAELTVRP